MFGEFISAFAGDSGSSSSGDSEDREEKKHDEAETASSNTFDFWGAASGLAHSVKRTTAELATTVRTTDWKAELQAFGEDLAEETEELSASAFAAAHTAVEGIEHLPQTAQGVLPAIEGRRRAVQAQLGQASSNLGRFGRDFVSNTTQIFEQASSAIQKEMAAVGSDGPKGRRARRGIGAASQPTGRAPVAARYSRLDSDIAAMQRNSATYCEQPDDSAGFSAWLEGFEMREHSSEIEAVRKETPFMVELERRIVPLIVDKPTFWRRYFYHVHLLQAAHEARAKVAARAASTQAEEASWDDEEPAEALFTAATGETVTETVHSTCADSSHSPKHDTVAESPSLLQPPSATEPSSAAATDPLSTDSALSAPVAGEGEPMQQLPPPARAAAASEGETPITASDASSSGGSGPPWTVVSSPTTKAITASASRPDEALAVNTPSSAAEPSEQALPSDAASLQSITAAAKPSPSSTGASADAPPPSDPSPSATTGGGDGEGRQGQEDAAAAMATAAAPSLAATAAAGGNGKHSDSGSDDSDWGANVEAAGDSGSSGGVGNSEEDWE